MNLTTSYLYTNQASYPAFHGKIKNEKMALEGRISEQEIAEEKQRQEAAWKEDFKALKEGRTSDVKEQALIKLTRTAVNNPKRSKPLTYQDVLEEMTDFLKSYDGPNFAVVLQDAFFREEEEQANKAMKVLLDLNLIRLAEHLDVKRRFPGDTITTPVFRYFLTDKGKMALEVLLDKKFE